MFDSNKPNGGQEIYHIQRLHQRGIIITTLNQCFSSWEIYLFFYKNLGNLWILFCLSSVIGLNFLSFFKFSQNFDMKKMNFFLGIEYGIQFFF